MARGDAVPHSCQRVSGDDHHIRGEAREQKNYAHDARRPEDRRRTLDHRLDPARPMDAALLAIPQHRQTRTGIPGRDESELLASILSRRSDWTNMTTPAPQRCLSRTARDLHSPHLRSHQPDSRHRRLDLWLSILSHREDHHERCAGDGADGYAARVWYPHAQYKEVVF